MGTKLKIMRQKHVVSLLVILKATLWRSPWAKSHLMNGQSSDSKRM